MTQRGNLRLIQKGSGLRGRTAWLCLFVILFNLFGPMSWVAAHEAAFDEATFCHAIVPDRPDGGASHDDAVVAHCPLCLIFAGAIVAPPGNAPIFTKPTPALSSASLVAAPQISLAGLRAHWRPSPRAPPFTI